MAEGASFGGQLLTGMGVGLGYGVLGDVARLGLLTAKWKLIPEWWRRDLIASTLQGILDAEKDRVTGLSAKGAVDVIVSFIGRTIDLAWYVDESIAIQMFVQMIQQSIAYAIHASHAGSIGTMANVFSGSASLSSARAQALNESTNELDDKERALLNASIGTNIPTLTAEAVKGANARLDTYLTRIIQDSETMLTEWNDLIMGYYRRYTTLAHQKYTNAISMKEDVVTRAYSLLEQIGNAHLSRINELSDTLDGANSWYEGGFLSGDELAEIALRIDLERQASEQIYDQYKESVLNSIDDALVDWDYKIGRAFNDLTEMENEWKLLILQAFSPVYDNVINYVAELVDICDTVIENVCAYRNIAPSTSVLVQERQEYEPPVTVDKSGSETFVLVESGVKSLPLLLEYIFTRGTDSPYDIVYDYIGGDPVVIDTSDDPNESFSTSERKLVKNPNTAVLYAIYHKTLGTKWQVYVKRSTDGGQTWIDPVRISTASGQENYDQQYESLAIDSAGNLHAVWVGGATGYTQAVWYSKYNGVSWSTPIVISTYTGMDTRNQYEPCLAVDSLDHLHVVWNGLATGYTTYPQIWYAKYDGSSWSTPIRLSTTANMASSWQGGACITPDSADKLHVVWNGGATGYSQPQIWYSKYDGSWSAPLRISTASGMQSYEQYYPCIAVDDSDDLHVVWSGKATGFIVNNQVWYAKYTSGAWVTPIRISTADNMQDYPQFDTTIGIDFEGYVTVIWTGYSDEYPYESVLFYSRYTTEWSTPTCIQPTGTCSLANIRWSEYHQ